MIKHFEFDSIVVGGGGAGLRTAMQLIKLEKMWLYYPKFFQHAHIPLQRKVELQQHLANVTRG